MILQALVEYYGRSADLAPEGWEWRPIPFLIELKRNGDFIQLYDMRMGTRVGDAKPILVPKAEIRPGTKSYEKPNLLWDHFGFVVGAAKSDAPKDLETASKQLAHFSARAKEVSERLPSSERLKAVALFYSNSQFNHVFLDPLWKECSRIPGCNFTFRIEGDRSAIFAAPEIQNLLQECQGNTKSEEAVEGVCLVSGEQAVIQKLHFPISGICDKPAPLLSINGGVCPSFTSFGKSQGYNFPVGEKAAFQYATALNHLLRYGSGNKLRIGASVVVFWAQKGGLVIEEGFGDVFGDPAEDDPNARAGRIGNLLSAVQTGQFDGGEGQDKFFVLGLAPNAARVTVRFWHASTIHEIGQRIRDWFDDLRIVRGPNNPEFPSLYRLLKDCAVLRDVKNIPPNLGGDVMRAVLSGGAYPVSWLNAEIIRCRAEQEVSYLRAAAIKACFNRSKRNSDFSFIQEFSEMLDPANVNPAYLLGRLFSVLERVQEKAVNPKSTIRDRYYGAASSTPAAVFATLLRLKNHHLSKLDEREAKYFERLIGDIMDGLEDFPKHLVLQDQGRFALGYYHQRNYRKPESNVTQIESTEGESK